MFNASEYRDSLAQYSLHGLELIAADPITTPEENQVIAEEARHRLTEQANALYDAGAR